MKRPVLIVLLLLALLLALPAAGEEASDLIVSGDYTYQLLPDGTAEIAGWNGTEHALQIPDTLDGHPVSAIGERAFEYKNCLSAVYIPGCVGRIGKNAFYMCEALLSVSIGDHLAYLTFDETMNENVIIQYAAIGMGAMDQCSGTVTLAESYGSEFQPIRHVYGLARSIPVKSRGKEVMKRDFSWVSDRFLARGFMFYTRSADELEQMLAWESETGITLLYPLLSDSTKESANNWYAPESTFTEDMKLTPRIARDKETGEPIRWEILPDDSRKIRVLLPAYYQYLYGFKPVYPTFGNPIFTISKAEPCADGLVIEEGAFTGAKWLTSFSLPSDPQSIRENLLSDSNIFFTIPFDSSLKDSLITRHYSNRYTCKGDTALPIDPTVHISGDFSYMVLEDQSVRITYCSAIHTDELIIPAELDGYPVTSLSTTALRDCTASIIHIPASVKHLSGAHFDPMYGLDAIHVAEDHPTYGSIDGVLIDKTSMTLLSFPRSYHTMDYTVPQGIRVIGSGAFRETAVTSVQIPGSVREIRPNAFAFCEELSSVSISLGTKAIGDQAFYRCISLKSINLPQTITRIGEAAFEHCWALTSLSIPTGVTVIEDRLLYGCTKLQTVHLPEGITSIGYRAFAGCVSLIVDIPKTVTYIGEEAFNGCTSLTSITIPDGIEIIEPNTFSSCLHLSEITIPGSVRTIGHFAFFSCRGLKRVNFLSPNSGINGFLNLLFSQESDTATTIGKYAFGDCSSLSSVTLPDHITFIDPLAFAYSTDNYIDVHSRDRITFCVSANSYAREWCIENLYSYETAK